ncbi:MAG TPA: NAD-dependent epimerase/dehydratase family protein [Kiritimatiellae bacterium]|nr:NAD-dependent epimerase/dehydratase family protein [Kiritimatiellia bacterium]
MVPVRQKNGRIEGPRLLEDRYRRIFVSGGAGFIGSHLVDILVSQGYEVTAYDNLSNGRMEFIERNVGKPNFTFIRADMLDRARLIEAVRGHDLVWHLAANTDIIGSHERPVRDLRDCVEATFNMVEAMRQCGIRDIVFSSTGAVYGSLCEERAVSEDAGPLCPISGYAAGKIGSEAFICCYCHMYGLRGRIFRFGNVIGARMTHGVIYDFINRLRESPHRLLIRGDGRQEKNYFLVEECIEGMAFGLLNAELDEGNPCEIFNLGTDSVTPVTKIAQIVTEEMGLKNTRIVIEGTPRAWPGDQPRVHITVEKINRLGWKARLSSDEAVRTAVRRMLGKEQG